MNNTIENCISLIIEATQEENGIRVSPRIEPVERINIYIARLFEKKGISYNAEDVEIARNYIIAEVYGMGGRLSQRLIGKKLNEMQKK